MNVLDLFSGIGGFTYALELCGFRTVAFCESNRFCRSVLHQHWPTIPCFHDVRTLNQSALARFGIDLICGGFPCQDISMSGTGVGLAGARSGLWNEFARLIGEIRPQYVLVENVAALLGRGLSEVLGDLAALGYDAEWHCIPAAYVRAPHRRDRLWIIAYPNSRRCEVIGLAQYAALKGETGPVAHGCRAPGFRHGAIADTDCIDARYEFDGAADGERAASSATQSDERTVSPIDHWAVEPNVGRVADGIPLRVDRLRALGNAVVPQVVQLIGRAIQQHASTHAPA